MSEMAENTKRVAPGKKKHSGQMNSVVRALKLLHILKFSSDINHPLSQKEILNLLKTMEGSNPGTEKTIKTDLHNLMKALNPYGDGHFDREDFEAEKDAFRILYDGVEEGRHRISGVRYVHEFDNDELELILSLIKSSDDLTALQMEALEKKIKGLGSTHYTYSTDAIRNLPKHSTIDKTYLKQNLWIIHTAITHNLKISYCFNHYDRMGNLVPVRERRYVVNPFYVVNYGQKYYLLCTVSNYQNVQIHRLDLMTDMELMEEEKSNIRQVPELEHSNAVDFMLHHPNMNYDKPRNMIHLKVNRKNGYNCIHDYFGMQYTFIKELDSEFDEIELTCSESAIVDLAIQYGSQIEVLRPASIRAKIAEKAQSLLDRYN